MLTSPKAAEPVGRRACRSAVSYGRRVCRSDLKSGQLSRRHFPGVNSPGLSGEIHTNFGNLQPVFHFVGDEVVFVVDLSEGGIRRAVHLELEDVDPVLSPADGVRPADCRLDFTLNIIPQQREDQVDDGLVVLLRLVFQVIRNAGKDTRVSLIILNSILIIWLTRLRNMMEQSSLRASSLALTSNIPLRFSSTLSITLRM